MGETPREKKKCRVTFPKGERVQGRWDQPQNHQHSQGLCAQGDTGKGAEQSQPPGHRQGHHCHIPSPAGTPTLHPSPRVALPLPFSAPPGLLNRLNLCPVLMPALLLPSSHPFTPPSPAPGFDRTSHQAPTSLHKAIQGASPVGRAPAAPNRL